MGGLGNQMFQYAAGMRLAMHHKTELKLDLTFLLDRTPQEKFVFRDFDLPVFGLSTPVASPQTIRHIFRQREWPLLTEESVKRFSRALKLETKSARLERLTRRAVEKLSPSYHFYTEIHPSFDPVVLGLPSRSYLEGFFQN